MKLNYCILFFLLFIYLSCNDKERQEASLPVINVEKDCENFEIKKLSDFASTIRYVKLELTENSLISEGLSEVYVEKDKIFVRDWDASLKVFDAYTGKYLYDIGRRGGGPGELPFLSYLDINVHENTILMSYHQITNKFDLDGNYIGKVIHPQLDVYNELINANLVLLEDSMYAAGIKTYNHTQHYACFVFDENQEIISLMKSYKDVKKRPEQNLWHPFKQSGNFYRYRDQVRYFRGISDTIYTYNKEERQFAPLLSIEYGKHQSLHDLSDIPHKENPEVISLSDFRENDKYFFIYFLMAKSPESFEDQRLMSDGAIFKFINRGVNAIYDKQTSKLTFLLQPLPRIMGLKNDLDNGIPFWPKTVTSDNQLVDYYHAYKFIEYAEQLSEADSSFKSFLQSCSEEDNPIVIIANSR